MADEAPAVDAPAAEGAGIKDVFTSPNGYQFYEIWTMSTGPGKTVGISVKGSKRYMTGGPGAWGGFNGLPHGPDPREGPPPSVETVLKQLSIPREELMLFESREKEEPWQIYSTALREEDKCMPFPINAEWSGFKTELPSLESLGPKGPPDHYKSFYPSTSHRGTVTNPNW